MRSSLHFLRFPFYVSLMWVCDAMIKSMFGSVVVVVFQIAFHAEIHANDVFLFFKNYF